MLMLAGLVLAVVLPGHAQAGNHADPYVISAFARQVSLADAPSGSGRHRGDAANFGRVGLFDADASANAAFGTSSADAPLPVPVDMYWTDPNWPLLVDDALASIAYSMRREPALDTSDVFFPIHARPPPARGRDISSPDRV